MAVPHPGLREKSAASIGSNGSTSSEDFSEIEATIHRLCDARNDDDGNRGLARIPAGTVAVLGREIWGHIRRRKIRDEGLLGASKTMDDNLSAFGKIVEIVGPLLHHLSPLGKMRRPIVGAPVRIERALAAWH
jgi:hypothetical protein